jgi:hypothetical protein
LRGPRTGKATSMGQWCNRFALEALDALKQKDEAPSCDHEALISPLQGQQTATGPSPTVGC